MPSTQCTLASNDLMTTNHPGLLTAPTAPSALNPYARPFRVDSPNLTGKNAWPTMNVSLEGSLTVAPGTTKQCGTNCEDRRGKSDRLTTRRLVDEHSRYSFKTPRRMGRNERDQLRREEKRGHDRFSNRLIPDTGNDSTRSGRRENRGTTTALALVEA